MRFRLPGAVLTAAVALLCAPCAHADNYPARDASNTLVSMAAKLVGGVLHPLHILEVMVSGSPTPLATGQAVKAASLPVTLASDPDYRPAGGAISAADVSTATAAGQASVTLVTGIPTANSALDWSLNGHSSATLTITGTFTAVLAIETSADGGQTFAPATAKILGTGATTATVTGKGVFRIDTTGMTDVRLRATAYTSGSASAQLAASSSAGLTQVLNPVRLADAAGSVTGVAANPLATAVQYAASGVAPVTPALTSATCSAAFTPIAGRAFNVSAWGTFVATYQLFRSFDAGTTKLPITAAGTVLYQWTAPASETAEETEYGVAYYVCATSYTSGTLNVRISQ